jgi:hypothetical protein
MRREKFTITEVDRAILLALSRFHYLTAAQASRLLYPALSDNNRYMQRRLKGLTDAGYVLRLRALIPPRYGQAPHVFTLAREGRRYGAALHAPIATYFRPSEESQATENRPFMAHRLATIDVMIAVACLCRDMPAVVCHRMLSERELKRGALRVKVPPRPGSRGTARTAVIPDAWFQLSASGHGYVEPQSIALELDRGTEDQRAWRHKVAAYTVWAAGPYRAVFETDNLTVATVCGDAKRLAMLTHWTRQELTARDLMSLADIFLFTSASPVTARPREFFCSPVWYQHDGQAVSLLEAPAGARPPAEGVVYQPV